MFGNNNNSHLTVTFVYILRTFSVIQIEERAVLELAGAYGVGVAFEEIVEVQLVNFAQDVSIPALWM